MRGVLLLTLAMATAAQAQDAAGAQAAPPDPAQVEYQRQLAAYDVAMAKWRADVAARSQAPAKPAPVKVASAADPDRLICRSIDVTGSNMPERKCATAAEWKAIAAANAGNAASFRHELDLHHTH